MEKYIPIEFTWVKPMKYFTKCIQKLCKSFQFDKYT